jgi:hypothetical protein
MITIARMSQLNKESPITIVGTLAFPQIVRWIVHNVAGKTVVANRHVLPMDRVEVLNGIETHFPV